VVKNRAAAYDPDDNGGFVTDIHFENIYGNCCVLTTAGDLLSWSDKLGNFPELETVPTLPNGKPTGYGFGLEVGRAHGTAEVFHSGATAGWRAFTARFPEKKISIALLCNRGDAPVTSMARQIADLFLPPDPPPAKHDFDVKYAGLYRDPKTDAVLRFFVKDGALRIGFGGNGGRVDPDVIHFEGDGVRLTNANGYESAYQRVDEWKPSADDLKKLAGRYHSDEIGVTYEVRLKDGALSAHLDPNVDFLLKPTFADAFHSEAGMLLRFTGDGFDVKSDFGMSSGTARLERLHFTRAK
jgi:hypothetical protein